MHSICEIIVREILPAIRALVVYRLYHIYGLTQVEIAKKLNVSQSAISRYLSGERGKVENILKNVPILSSIAEEMAKRYANGEKDIPICDYCDKLKKDEKFMEYVQKRFSK